MQDQNKGFFAACSGLLSEDVVHVCSVASSYALALILPVRSVEHLQT